MDSQLPPASAPSSPKPSAAAAAESTTPASKAKTKRPKLHIYKDTKAYTLIQQHELVNEIVYADIQFEIKKNGSVSTISLDPAALVSGSLQFFWLEVCKAASDSPAFKSKNQIVIPTTARTYFEAIVESKKDRMMKGESHEECFMKTGEGDSDDDDLDSALEKAKKEAIHSLSYQMEEMLSMHVQKILHCDSENTSAQQRATAASKIPQGFNAPSSTKSSAKRQLLPAAPEGELVNASMNGAGGKRKIAESESDLAKIRKKQKDQQFLEYQNESKQLSESMLAMCKPLSLEDSAKLASVQANAYTVALSTAVTAGMREWKAQPENPKPKSDFLTLSSDQLFDKIKEIGDTYASNITLKDAIKTTGVDGEMLGFMADIDIKDFFVNDCKLSPIHAAMLLAKIKGWKTA
jgi:hypothetical protein